MNPGGFSASNHPQNQYRQQPQQYNIQGLSARPFTQAPPPVADKPTDHDFYLYEGGERKINHEFLKIHFFSEGRLTEAQALYILESATNIFSREPNMVPLKSPVTICGDINGQYFDLIKMFEVGGTLQDSLYLFLGDYVDKGDFGIECLLYLYTLKTHSPGQIVLLRGHHECRRVTEYFTFKSECLHKYSENVYEACLRSFCALPIAALVDGKFLCVHGGISPSLIHLSDLASINRFQEPGFHGLLCDLLWADLIQSYGHENEPSAGLNRGTTFLHNGIRECSYFYTYDAVCQFLERNNLLTVIRGHEAQGPGYKLYRKTAKRNFPSVISIFSAPNHPSPGAILHYANQKITIRQYTSAVRTLSRNKPTPSKSESSPQDKDDAMSSNRNILLAKRPMMTLAELETAYQEARDHILRGLEEDTKYMMSDHGRPNSHSRVDADNVLDLDEAGPAFSRTMVANNSHTDPPLNKIVHGQTQILPLSTGIKKKNPLPTIWDTDGNPIVISSLSPGNVSHEDDLENSETASMSEAGSVYSHASSYTMSTEYGLYYTRRVLSQESLRR